MIKRKRYNEARAILEPISSNETATKWLALLNEIAPVSLDDPFENEQSRVVSLALGAVSLITGVAGIVILAGLLLFVVQGSQRGYSFEYAGMLPWGIAALVLLPTAYITRKLRR